MQLRINPRPETDRFSHTLTFPDLPERLLKQGFSRIVQVQSGSAEAPGLAVKLDASGSVPRSVNILDPDVSLQVQPYDKHSSLNATVVLHGMIQELSKEHGLTVTSAECRGGAGKDALAIRVRLDSRPDWLSREGRLPEELGARDMEALPEGAKKKIVVNAFERSPKARQRCLEHYGPRCVVCGFASGDVYGEDAQGIIHVHHVKPLKEIGAEYNVDPVTDLRPVCPNCHAVIHSREPALGIDEVAKRIQPGEAVNG